MHYNKHRFGRWQMHAKYAGGRPDPNVKPLGNSSGDKSGTVKAVSKANAAQYTDGFPAVSEKARAYSLAYLDRIAGREEWTTVNRARDHERIVRHAQKVFDGEYKKSMRALQEDYGKLERQLEAEVARKGLEMSGIREFNQWVKDNPFEKVSRIYTRLRQIADKEDKLRVEMMNSVIKELSSFQGLSERMTELSQSQADLMMFIKIAALHV